MAKDEKKNSELIESIFGSGSYATRMYVNRGRFWFACKESHEFSHKRGELKIIGPGGILRSLSSQNNEKSEKANVLALQFNEKTRHGIIDIDNESKYKNELFIDKLYGVCDQVGLKVIRLQSSNSGGWHLLFTFKEATKSLIVYKLLASVAYLSGVKSIENGQCEIYPNPKSKTQKVRLPGQIEQYMIDTNFDIPLKEDFGFNFSKMNHRDKLNALDKMFNSEFYTNQEKTVNKIIESDISLNKWYLFGKKTGLKSIDEFSETDEEFNKRVGKKASDDRGAIKFYGDKDLPEIRLNLEIVKNYNSKRESAANFFNDLGYSGINLFNRGVMYYKNGLSNFGTRLDAIISIGYALYFSGYKASERETILCKWIQAKHNNKSKDWLKRPDFVLSQIKELTHWDKVLSEPENYYMRKKITDKIFKKEDISIRREKFEIKCAKQLQNNRLLRAINISKLYYASTILNKNKCKITPANIMKVSDIGRATIYRIKESLKIKELEEIPFNKTIVNFLREYDKEINLELYRAELMKEIGEKFKQVDELLLELA